MLEFDKIIKEIDNKGFSNRKLFKKKNALMLLQNLNLF